MGRHESELAIRLDDLARRVAALERRLADAGATPAEPAKAVSSVAMERTWPRADAVPEEAAPSAPTVRVDAALTRIAEASASVGEPTPAGSDGRAEAGDLERWIGARWYAACGAIIVVVGIALFVKLAFDRGWFELAPALRCVLGGLFGAGMLATAEVVRRRIAPVAAAGLYIAGLGSIYASVYAAYRMYDLLAAPTSLSLLGAVAVLGVVIAIRAGLPLVGIVSCAIGFATPFFFGGAEPRPMVVPVYVLSLQAASLMIVALMGPTYRTLRHVAWWGVVINYFAWPFGHFSSEAVLEAVFVGCAWAFVHAELIFSSWRERLKPQAPSLLALAFPRAPSWDPTISSFAMTMLALHTGASILGWYEQPFWPVFGVATLITGVLASLLVGFPRAFLERVPGNRGDLAMCLALQSAVTLVLTIATAFDGYEEVVVWLMVALVALVAAHRLRKLSLFGFAMTCMILVTGRLVLHDSHRGPHEQDAQTLAGLSISLWTLWMVLAAFLWVGAARVLAQGPSTPESQGVPPTLAGTGCLMLLASVANGSEAASLSTMWMLAAIGFALIDRVDRQLGFLVHAWIAGAGALAAWLVAYPPAEWTNRTGWFHPGLMGGLMVAAAFAWIAVHARRAPAIISLARLATVSAVLVLLLATSLDVARLARQLAEDATAQRSALSIWWAIFAAGLIAVGFWKGLGTPRRAGLVLLGLAATKAIFIDLRDVPATWRVASFLGIGLLMLGVGVVYSRLSARLESGGDGARR